MEKLRIREAGKEKLTKGKEEDVSNGREAPPFN